METIITGWRRAALLSAVLAMVLAMMLASVVPARADEAETASALARAWEALDLEISGFVEAAGGLRLQNDPHQSKDASLAETRLQLKADRYFDWGEFSVRNDVYYDAVTEEFENDLREAHFTAWPLDWMDLRVGRQILTWGTGDLIFLNDLFPKDWNAFFIGRDVEYLKAPSDAAKVSFFTDLVNVNVVYTPRFNPDRYIDGERISYWNPLLGRRAGEADRLRDDEPDRWFTDDEIALRFYRNVGSYEYALYFYDGFWKSPGGFDDRGRAIFPKLRVFGGSGRGPVGPGIGNVELAYYDSREDRRGDDPFINNSQFRFLTGYEQVVATDLTLGGQYYLEHWMRYGRLRETAPDRRRLPDENRHVVTFRVTQLAMQQNLTLSFFAFYSPSDQDAYLRPSVSYKFTDAFGATVGGNVFIGEDDHTFFGQFEDNNNIYARLRYSF